MMAPVGRVRCAEVVGPSSRRAGKAVHFVTAYMKTCRIQKKKRKQDLGEGAGIYHDHDVEW